MLGALTPLHPQFLQVKSSVVFQDLYFPFCRKFWHFYFWFQKARAFDFWTSSIILLSIKADKSSSLEKEHHGKGTAPSLQTTFLYSYMGSFDVLNVRILTKGADHVFAIFLKATQLVKAAKTWAVFWCKGELGPVHLPPCLSAREEADFAQTTQGRPAAPPAAAAEVARAGCATSTTITRGDPQTTCTAQLSGKGNT